MKNLVMGVAKSYSWDILEPFVISFSRNCRSAELILFVDDISDFTRGRLQSVERVHVVDIPVAYREILIIHLRWKMCADILERFGANYAQAFITDTRDVIFQSDIFASFKGYQKYLGYTTESDIIGNDKIYNYAWLESCFGAGAAARLSDKKIICCGTIIGTINEVKIFCRIMWDALKDKTIWGHEQATMNYLVYENLLPLENLVEIGVDGEIFTMGLAENFSIRGDKILSNGGVPAVVHQYNRHNELINMVDEIYHDKNFRVDVRFTDMRSVIEQATSLLFADKVGDAARFFMKKFLVTKDFSGCVKGLLRFWSVVMREPLSPASELLELSAQSALKSVEKFSGSDLNEICILLNRAQESRHPLDPELRIRVVNYLLQLAEQKFLSGEREQYLSCLDLIISIEGGRVDWLRR